MKRLARQTRSVLRRLRRSWDRRARPHRLDILTYHFVTAREHLFNRGGHRIAPDVFRAQLCWLRERYQLVALRDLPRLQPGPRPLLAITFDDGYASNLAEAAPILEQMQIRATIFVCPSVLDNRDLLWRDKIRYLINRDLDKKFIAYLRTLPDHRYRFERLEQLGFYTWSKHLPSIGDMQIQHDVAAFCAEEGIDTGKLAASHELFLASDQIRPLDSIDFGAHSWSHPIMPGLDFAAQRDEISRAQDFLASRGGSVGFALPFTDYNADTVRACSELAVPFMLTVKKRSNPLARVPGVRILDRWMAPTSVARLAEIL